MRFTCLLGHDWEHETSTIETGEEEIETRKELRKCTKCGREEVQKRETQVSIASAEQRLGESSITGDSGEAPEPPYEEDELDEDEEQYNGDDDALIIDGGDSENTEEDERELPDSESVEEDDFNPSAFNGDVKESEPEPEIVTETETSITRTKHEGDECLYCSECEYQEPFDSSTTLREGDICPNCTQEYVEKR